MKTLILNHPTCELHEAPIEHPECPDRLRAINKMIQSSDWEGKLFIEKARPLNINALYKVHPKNYVDAVLELSPHEGVSLIGNDTYLNPYSIDAALLAAGSAFYATDEVISGNIKNAFCAVRPPGHHAESTITMGFCLFNSVALAAERALSAGMKRIAIVDFDVHHGNGTVDIFKNRPEVLVCSSFQYPFYPRRFDQINKHNICLTPLNAGCSSEQFRASVEPQWRNAMKQHQPEMIFVSAGFDAHTDDPLGGLNLGSDDFLWVTQLIKEFSEDTADGKIISLLEGGYNLPALAESVNLHLKGLIGLH